MAWKHKGSNSETIRVSGVSGLEAARYATTMMPKEYTKALVPAINRALSAGQTKAARAVSQNYTVRVSDARKTLVIEKAYIDKQGRMTTGRLISTGSRLPLEYFKHSPGDSDTTGNKRKQIRVAVRRDGGAKNLAGGFKWNGRIMSRGDFFDSQETLAARIKQHGRWYNLGHGFRYGPSIPEMLGTESVRNVVIDHIEDVLRVRMNHEILRLLNKK